jgi:cell division protein FtsQ
MTTTGLTESRRMLDWGNALGVRITSRAGALLFICGALLLGLADGGHLEFDGSPYGKIAGKLAGLVGYAANDIRISGLVHQDAESVLTTIGVQPGGSLIGFDAAQARSLLENVDWVSSAKVMRRFPNQLEITVVEREPFAVWQRDGRYYVIDRSGAAISTLPPSAFTDLLLVTGEGAQTEVAALVRELDAHPQLKARIKAAARAGQRRWNAVLDNGVTLELPEHDMGTALNEAVRLDREHGLLSKGITQVDLRIPGKTAITIAEVQGSENGLKASGQ